ncbi:MAG: PHP domain-containing protein [Christensenellaceae bacterium]|jgi:putative hydrolase|nr:PHP domain-containing protein [Christensenellaceae bacterium]
MKLYGDLHTHTIYSDGHSTVEDNVKMAVERGLKQLAITDHGHGKFFGGGMNPKDYEIIKAQIKKSSAENGIEVFFGVEANITGSGGQIDIKTAEFGEFDIVLCGIHRGVKAHRFFDYFTFFIPNWFFSLFHWTPKRRIEKNTQTVINAIEKNNIDILVHPNRYFKTNVLEVAKACIARGTVMELNAKRISFRPVDFERMVELGAKFVIGSDAHFAKNVGKVDRVEEFLKLCDYPPDAIINLNEPFARPKGKVLQEIIEDELDNDN